MIATVTPNAALDVTYEVDSGTTHVTHRVRNVVTRAGGKGVNVATVLAQLGRDVLATGFLGGADGDRCRILLSAAGVAQEWVWCHEETRRTVAVVDPEGVTLFTEPGAPRGRRAWDDLSSLVIMATESTDVVVLSGSTPPGEEPELGRLVAALRHAGRSTVVDTSGEALRFAAEAGADIVAPNSAEAADATGIDDIVGAGQMLLDAGAGAVVLSDGPRGLTALTRSGVRRARPRRMLRGNPTGAGDACTAALAMALHDEPEGPDRVGLAAMNGLREAVAMSAAAVLVPVAGRIHEASLASLRADVDEEQVDAR